MAKKRCLRGRVEEVAEHEGKYICMATHPDFPNKDDDRARGRKWHLSNEGDKKSLCGCIITDYIPKSEQWFDRKICKNCLSITAQNNGGK